MNPQTGPERPADALAAAESSGARSAASDALSAPEGHSAASATPAERLRLAADLIEQTAAAATPGPWQPEHAYLNRSRVQGVFVECDAQDSCGDVDCLDGTHGIGGFDRDPDNRWAILVGPQLAGPLAAWLRDAADLADVNAYGLPLAVADMILGGQS